jgi:hypothetical protein
MRIAGKKSWFGLLIISIFISSCYKISNTTATITVSDQNGKKVPGAVVHVFPTKSDTSDTLSVINPDLDETKTTDNAGQVFFDYTEYYKAGQVGLFVLDVDVNYTGPDSVITTHSVLKVEEQKDNQKQIELPFVL